MFNKNGFSLALCLLLICLCYTFPVDEIPKNGTRIGKPMIMGETVVMTTPLYIQNRNTTPATTPAPSKENHKQNELAITDSLENEFSFLPERMPDLPDDEYLDISEDSTPLHFLKQQQTNKRVVVPKPTKDVVGTISPPAAQNLPMTIASPIYITVPIYINTQGGLPLSLSIAGQEVPLGSAAENSQQSESKKPLKYDEPPKRSPVRQTNRHRSNVRSKIYARRDRNSPVQYTILRTPNKLI